ncbi:MAG: methylated-DNA--[protein]-cysteine S-methyltransferase [Thiolinea sp.]
MPDNAASSTGGPDPHGTDFQQRVWQQLLRIPFGQSASYRDIAEALNKPTATRAVGAANGQNPISIIVPCHRVIGSNGQLTGYAGGLERKAWLLQHEGLTLL